MLYVEFLFLLLMLYIGSRYGGIGLGVVSGIGLVNELLFISKSKIILESLMYQCLSIFFQKN